MAKSLSEELYEHAQHVLLGIWEQRLQSEGLGLEALEADIQRLQAKRFTPFRRGRREYVVASRYFRDLYAAFEAAQAQARALARLQEMEAQRRQAAREAEREASQQRATEENWRRRLQYPEQYLATRRAADKARHAHITTALAQLKQWRLSHPVQSVPLTLARYTAKYLKFTGWILRGHDCAGSEIRVRAEDREFLVGLRQLLQRGARRDEIEQVCRWTNELFVLLQRDFALAADIALRAETLALTKKDA